MTDHVVGIISLCFAVYFRAWAPDPHSHTFHGPGPLIGALPSRTRARLKMSTPQKFLLPNTFIRGQPALQSLQTARYTSLLKSTGWSGFRF